jgi:hypothetical protein
LAQTAREINTISEIHSPPLPRSLRIEERESEKKRRIAHKNVAVAFVRRRTPNARMGHAAETTVSYTKGKT